MLLLSCLQVSPKHPDFKRKDGSCSLWLGSAPKQILKELKGLESDVQVQKLKEVKQFKGLLLNHVAFPFSPCQILDIL